MDFPIVSLGSFTIQHVEQVRIRHLDDGFVGIGIHMIISLVENGEPGHVFPEQAFPADVVNDPKKLAAAIKTVALAFFDHELDENLKIDGQIVNNPHTNDARASAVD